jgi:hypothetical protein
MHGTTSHRSPHPGAITDRAGGRGAWVARRGDIHPPKPWPGLDLAVIGPQALTLDEQAARSAVFSESDLPWRVDVVDWLSASESFRKHITAAWLPLKP